MDERTKTTLENFINFLQKELLTSKEYRHIRIAKWSVNDYKMTVEVFINQNPQKIYFDVREIKENENHFMHLLTSAHDQLMQINT